MFLEFKAFPQEIESQPNEENNFLPDLDYISSDRKYFGGLQFEDRKRKSLEWKHFTKCLLIMCECFHPDYSHRYRGTEISGQCDYPLCSCEKFVSIEVCITLDFTMADLFEIKNPNHSESDSPKWWIEFGDWYEKWQMTIT